MIFKTMIWLCLRYAFFISINRNNIFAFAAIELFLCSADFLCAVPKIHPLLYRGFNELRFCYNLLKLNYRRLFLISYGAIDCRGNKAANVGFF